MSVIKAYSKGWGQVFRNWKMWLLLFAMNVFFALTSALPFNNYFNAKIGDSLALQTLLERFDFGIMSDFLNNYGFGLSILINQSRMMIGLYLLLSVFLMGGIVKTVQNQHNRYHAGEFWGASAQYFWRFLRLTVYFLLIHAVVFAIFATLFFFLSDGMSPDNVRSEKTIINALKITGVFYLFTASIVRLVQDYSKIHIVESNTTYIFSSIINGIQIVFKNFFRTFPLMLLNILTLVLFYGIFKLLDLNIYANSWASIFLLFVVGQAFIFSRIALKIHNIAADYRMYQILKTDDGPPPITTVDELIKQDEDIKSL